MPVMKSLTAVKMVGGNCLDCRDNVRECGVNRCPCIHKEITDSRYDACEEYGNRSPDAYKEILDTSPDLISRRAEPAENHIGNIFDDVEDVLESGDQQIPDGNENALDTVPHLFLVTREQPHENIQYTENDTRCGGEDIGNIYKHSLEHGGDHGAERIPCGFQHFDEILKIKVQLIDPRNDAVRKSGERLFDLIPDAYDVILKLVIRVPQMHKRRHQSCNCRNHGKNRAVGNAQCTCHLRNTTFDSGNGGRCFRHERHDTAHGLKSSCQ